MFRKVAIAALLLLGASLTASAEVVPERKTLQVVNDVTSQVRQYTRFTIFDDVNVRVGQNGVATLTGAVTMPFKKDDIGQTRGQVPGVRRSTTSYGAAGVAVRRRAAVPDRAGHLSNTAFWHYAAMANPPIHIVVENGRVTLTGVVQNNVDRMLARSLATTFGAFSVKNDLKTDAEMKELLEKL